MTKDTDRPDDARERPAANDNGNARKRANIDAAVLRIARLIGRQIAREEFERRHANDNQPPTPKRREE
jgi:hypothetical protein